MIKHSDTLEIRELAAKLIELNINQLENKISKKDAEIQLRKLVDLFVLIEEKFSKEQETIKESIK